MAGGINRIRYRPERPVPPQPHPDYAFPPPSRPVSLSGHSSRAYAQRDPYAGLKRHVPEPGLLGAHGLADVDALVARVNALLAGRGMPALNRGEFPNGKAKFTRVLKLASTLRAQID